MRKLIGVLMVFGMLIVFCSGSVLAQTTPIHWKMVSPWAPNQLYIEIDRTFSKLVNEMTGGRLQIKLFAGGELVPLMGIFDAVSKGSVECAGDWSTFWGGKNSAFDLISTLPMGFSQYDFPTWYYQAGGKDICSWLYGKYNMVYFMSAAVPSDSAWRTRVPIKTLADFKGKKLRTVGSAQGHILRKLGGSQVPVAPAEIYQALQMGVIDGGEFGDPATDWGMGLGEVTKYNTTPSWHSPGGMFGIIINKDAWNKLPDDLKGIVEHAAAATVAYIGPMQDYMSIKGLENFNKKGVQVFRLSNEDLNVIEKYSWEYIEQEAKKNPDYLKVVLSTFQYLKDFRDIRAYKEPFNFGRNPTTLPNLPGLK